MTLVSILFDSALSWTWVTSNPDSSAQIFAFMPSICGVAVGISGGEIQTYGLQVNIPSSYKSPADVGQLGTIWLGYMPQNTVNTLAAQIKVASSAFYTGLQNPVAQSLAQHVVSGFAVDSVSDPNGGQGGSNAVASGGSTTEGSSKSREDAIIGVVSALGAIALCVLAFLVYRSVQRRRELRHHRLSDPPNTEAWNAGVRQEARDFDQDSIGGQRRRSFYFAEDSLRTFSQYGAPQQQQQNNNVQEMAEAMRTSPTSGMTQRRVLPSAISAPRLQESTMNW